jgi:hypothetical protein
MRAIAHSPSFAKKVGVKQAVGRDFEMADKKKIRKFSEGGAQGKYDRRMADIKKDFEKDSRGKSGKALEVLAAKRAQRTADAEDDRAKRTGADRTATRAAEKAAEANLTRTRRFGADKPVAAAAPAKTSEPAKASTPEPTKALEVAKAKPQSFNEAFSAARKAGLKTFKWEGKPGTTFTTQMAGRPSTTEHLKTGPKSSANIQPIPVDKGKSSIQPIPVDKGKSSIQLLPAAKPKTPATTGGTLLRGKPGGAPLISGSDTRAFITYGDAAAKKNATNKAKGGKIKKEKVMKYAKGGSTPPQPSAADRARSKKRLDELKKLKPTAEEGKVAASANRSEGPGYKKGGKAKAKGKNSFAATKFGAAMMKKSDDTKGRAMPKFAKGGSIDGCATKGKTKTSMVKMKSGGSC